LKRDVAVTLEAKVSRVPLRRLNRRAAPTRLLHDDADSLVPHEHSQRFLVAARRSQHDVGLVTMSGIGH